MRTLLLGLTVIALTCHGAEVPASRDAPAAIAPAEELDEVRVTARAWELRREIAAVEKRFFGLFNRINSQDDYDIQCTLQPGPNTKIKQRVCRPRFLLNAQSNEAIALLDGMMLNDRVSAVMPVPAAVAAREKEFSAAARAVIATSPELQQLSQLWQELLGKHAAAQ